MMKVHVKEGLTSPIVWDKGKWKVYIIIPTQEWTLEQHSDLWDVSFKNHSEPLCINSAAPLYQIHSFDITGSV